MQQRKEHRMAQETIEREFVVTAPASMTVSNVRGSVNIQAGSDDVVTVTAVKHLDTGDPDRTEIEIWQQEDGSVIAKTRYHEDGWRLFGRRQPCKVDYIVHVPRACDARIKCVSSKAAIEGLEGEFDVKTVSGKVILKDLSGRVKATSVSGAIFGTQLSGATEFESVSGKVHLVESDLPIVTGSSVSGHLVLETPLGEGPYRFKTVSGDMKLVLPTETGFTVGFRSMSGSFKTSLPATRSQRRGHNWHTELCGGGPDVHFSSVSGSLSVMSAA
jgi:hypothetical protein